jgi:apolipoprotein N-acyltransferase
MTISRARLILLACASGLLYPLSFPAFDLGIVAWFALVPLHIAVEYLSPGARSVSAGFPARWPSRARCFGSLPP